MHPPSYSDIGKPANDLLGKDYPVGSAKLEVNTTTPNGIKFTVNGNKDNKSGHIASDIKAKFTDKAKGLVFTETWTTNNVLGAQLELTDSIAPGLKLDLNASLLPEKGTKNAKAGLEYKQEHVFTRSSLDLFKGPTLYGDVVIGNEGFVLGADVAYDVSDAKVTKYGLAAGYIAPLFSVSVLSANKFNVFTASYHQKVTSEVEAGAKAVWNKAVPDSNVGIEVGTKVLLDKTTFFKAKVDNQGRLGLGYTNTLRPGIKMAVGGLFDTTRLNADVHKLGVQFTFEG
ncbi:eukaryotic porin/Tom40 [Globomyces pollinis-pini]|nr:eukaryotic porin/Tom40 [Globomyces pollinis-pini]KAJ2994917.1 Mitochondrial porin [Globomyces sp. JEL0801]